MDSFNLSEVVEITSRFGRSVNLERDFYGPVSLDGYVLTTTARQALARLGEGCTDAQARALTLTGLYGAGKSTFALFAAKLLSGAPEAAKLLQDKDFALWQKFFEGADKPLRLFSILVSGTREPLAHAILRGVKKALHNVGDARLQPALAQVEQLEAKQHLTGRHLLKLFSAITPAVTAATHANGFLVILDELGKLLEFIALRPDESDIFVLQELAEASRQGAAPLFLITILHQAFERYAARLGRREREEWMKVQGRFEDLPFQEPNEQTLHILRQAFRQNTASQHWREFHDYGHTLAQAAWALRLCGHIKETEAVTLLRGCLPLHPTVALTLGPLFRRFGQNERSLFAFLTSNEPFGLQEFLRATHWTATQHELIRLDRVYDYLVAALGSALYSGGEGRKWAEIETAINRLPDAGALDIRLLKTIGLLRLLGDVGRLKSSRAVLCYVLADEINSADEITQTLEYLRRQSIIIERRYNDTWALWEGSDIDLGERFRAAAQQIDPDISLAASLTDTSRPRPLVAKRHSYQTGTLRYFEVIYLDAKDFPANLPPPKAAADGRIVFVLAPHQRAWAEVAEKLARSEVASDAQTIFALPKDLTGLREALWTTACWRWVRENTPELAADRVASRELTAELSDAVQKVAHWLHDLQNNAARQDCLWFWQGREQAIANGRELSELLSAVCAAVFPHTPVLKNEIINRRALSSAGTAARRALFEAMLVRADQPQLGIEGFPPQLSMYFSLLQETTIHRAENGALGFFPPRNDADAGIRAVWQRIADWLPETETKRRTVSDLFAALQTPPFGLKMGVLPVLLSAALLHYDAEVALYERGNFVPKLTLPIFERLCHAPATFTLQLCRMDGVRSQVLEKMAQVLLPQRKSAKALKVLTMVRPLTRFATELNDYTRHTSRVSKVAANIRRALFAAREPDRLIFQQLPEACGFAAFTSDTHNAADKIEAFSRKLHNGLGELRRAYEELLRDIERMLASGFLLRETDAAGRAELQRRAALIADFVASAKLKSFVLRVSDTTLETGAWLESIAALLAGKPPAVWHDTDLARFEMELAELARGFTSLENLAFERRRLAGIALPETEFMRLSFTRLGEPEHERVVAVCPQERELMQETENLLLQAFDQSRLNGNLEMRLAVLAQLSLKILKQIEND